MRKVRATAVPVLPAKSLTALHAQRATSCTGGACVGETDRARVCVWYAAMADLKALVVEVEEEAKRAGIKLPAGDASKTRSTLGSYLMKTKVNNEYSKVRRCAGKWKCVLPPVRTHASPRARPRRRPRSSRSRRTSAGASTCSRLRLARAHPASRPLQHCDALRSALLLAQAAAGGEEPSAAGEP